MSDEVAEVKSFIGVLDIYGFEHFEKILLNNSVLITPTKITTRIQSACFQVGTRGIY